MWEKNQVIILCNHLKKLIVTSNEVFFPPQCLRFIHFKGRVRETERSSYLLIHPAHGHNIGAGLIWNQKLGASSQSLTWVQALESSYIALPGTLAGSWIRSRATRTQNQTPAGCRHQRGSFIRYTAAVSCHTYPGFFLQHLILAIPNSSKPWHFVFAIDTLGKGKNYDILNSVTTEGEQPQTIEGPEDHWVWPCQSNQSRIKYTEEKFLSWQLFMALKWC